MDENRIELARRELWRTSQHRTVFSSLYSVLSNTVWTKLADFSPANEAASVILKSDAPLEVKLSNDGQIFRDIYDLEILRGRELQIRRQNSTIGIESLVRVYVLSPREVWRFWNREFFDYPSVMLSGNVVISGAATSGTLGLGSFAPDPDNFITEGIFVHSVYIVQTGVSGAPAAANFRTFALVDAQGTPEEYYQHYENSSIATDTPIRIVPEFPVKCPLTATSVELFISVAPGGVTSRTFNVRLNCKYR